MIYQPKTDIEKKKSALEKATFKNHMFSQKERERKVSSSTLQSNRERYDDTEIIVDDFVTPAIPPTVAPPAMKAPSACLTYNTRVSWKLKVKKEVFRPSETLGPPAVVDLLFAQIIADVFGPCLRISNQERQQANNFLNSQGFDLKTNRGQQVRSIVKRQLIDTARSWPLYFARLFAVNGTSPQYPDVSILAVHQSGVFLTRRENDILVISKAILYGDLQNAVSV